MKRISTPLPLLVIALAVGCPTTPPDPTYNDVPESELSEDSIVDDDQDRTVVETFDNTQGQESHDTHLSHDDTSVSVAEPGVALGDAECEAHTAWSMSREWDNRYVSAFFAVTPNGGLLVDADSVNTGTTLWRTDAGTRLSHSYNRAFLDVDGSWTRRVGIEYNDDSEQVVRVAHVVTDEIIVELPEPAVGTWLGADLSAGGDLLAAVSCTHSWDEDASSTVEVHQLNDDGTSQVLLSETIAQPCVTGWSSPAPALRVVQSADARWVFFSTTDASLHRFNVDTGEHTLFYQKEATDDAQASWAQGLLGLDINPSGDTVAFVSSDSTLMQRSVADGSVVGVDRAVGTQDGNVSVYATPYIISPVRYSPDGNMLAIINEDKNVALVPSDDPTTEWHVVDVPEEGEETWSAPGEALGLAFSTTGSDLYVSRTGFIERIACGPVIEAPDHPFQHVLDVLLDGPQSLTSGEAGTFTATHLGQIDLHAHTFYVDGEVVNGFGGFDRELVWTPSTPGTYEISVVVDDGQNTGNKSMTVAVE